MTTIKRLTYIDKNTFILHPDVFDINDYNIETLSDGLKLLRKKEPIKDLSDEIKTIEKNELINDDLTDATIYLTSVSQIKDFDFTKSEITECYINNKKFKKLNYLTIMNKIYNIINDKNKIMRHTTININDGIPILNNEKGFRYLENLKINVQGTDANKSIYEIIHQSEMNKITIEISIILKTGEFVEIQTKNY